MSENSDNLKEKPCRCGGLMGQIVGFDYRSTDGEYHRYRVGWYCKDCKEFEKAILRERQVNEVDDARR